MAAERLAIVEQGCWLDHVADLRKLATAPTASSCSGGNEMLLVMQYALNRRKLPAYCFQVEAARALFSRLAAAEDHPAGLGSQRSCRLPTSSAYCVGALGWLRICS